MPIAVARSLSIGATVTVSGVVTAEAGRLGMPVLESIQDGSAGIFVRLPDGVVPQTRGSSTVVTGVLAAPYGQLELRPALGGIAAGDPSQALPIPIAIDASALGEGTEGRLVRLIAQVSHAPTRTTAGDLVAVVTDDEGHEARTWIDGSSGIAPSDLRVGARYRLTGIVGQRASRKGRLDGYRLWLRDRADIELLSTASTAPSTGPSAGVPRRISIAAAILAGSGTVSVEGVVTAPASLLDASRRLVVVQDATGAIEVRTPAGGSAPVPGRRIVVTGTVGRAYGAPRIVATALRDAGPGGLPSALVLHVTPGAAHEWRLVRVSGTVLDVRRLGDRWRAELLIGRERIPIVGLSGAGIPSTALAEGHRATIVGIVRRPYPTALDRRFSIVPRSPSDVALGRAGGTGSGATGEGSTGRSGAGGGGLGEDPAADGARLVDLVDLGAHVGQRVRVGGLIASLTADGFVLEDGTASAAVVLLGEAADFRDLLEPGDALDAMGQVESAGGKARVVVKVAADLVRVGDPGIGSLGAGLGEGIGSSATMLGALGGTAAGGRSAGSTTARASGLASLPDLTTAGLGWLVVAGLTSIGVAVVRRQRLRHRLTPRLAQRLAALAPPPEPRP